MSSTDSKRWNNIPQYTPGEYLTWAEDFRSLAPGFVRNVMDGTVYFIEHPANSNDRRMKELFKK